MARICINLHRTSHVTMVPYQNMAEKAVFLTVFFENCDFVRCLHFQGPTRHICRGVCDAMSSDIQKGDGFAGQADLTMFTINAFAFRGKTTAHYGMITPDYKKLDHNKTGQFHSNRHHGIDIQNSCVKVTHA